MRARLALLAALGPLALPALADDAPTLELTVGVEQTGLGIMPRCDDLAVVAVSADGRGLRGLKPGTTICSFDVTGGGGGRRVYRVVVIEPKPRGPARNAEPETAGGPDAAGSPAASSGATSSGTPDSGASSGATGSKSSGTEAAPPPPPPRRRRQAAPQEPP